MTQKDITQQVIEVEVEGRREITQQVIEAEVESLPRIAQFLLEVEVNDRQVRVAQFLLEVEVPEIPTIPDPGGIVYAQAQISADDIHMDDFTADAQIQAITNPSGSITARAQITADKIVQQKNFSADAVIDRATILIAQARISGHIPDPTDYYPYFNGPYEIRLLDHDGTLIFPIEKFTHLEFRRTVTGPYFHGYGDYQIRMTDPAVDTSEFTLDRILSVRRLSDTGPVKVFEGLQRMKRDWMEGEDPTQWFISAGPDFKHFMKRRKIRPFPYGRAFFSITAEFTDIMRQLVNTNAGIAAPYTESPADMRRRLHNLKIEGLQHEGMILQMHYRHTALSAELDLLSELGADWDIIREGEYFWFKVFFPYKGFDRRRGNSFGNPEMVFSADRNNIVNPVHEVIRTEEVTAIFVAGEGIGAAREIVLRTNIAGHENDSPWNWIEAFEEGSKETSIAALNAFGDAFLVEHGRKLTITIEASPAEILSYGQRWNLGDMCTVDYKGETWDTRIVEVKEILEPESRLVTIQPTFLIYPRLEDY